MTSIKTLSCDIETYSSVDLTKAGLYRYAESPDFEILLFGYSVDGGSVQVVDLTCGEKIPDDVLSALADDNVIKFAHNSAFERICLSRYLGFPTGTYLDPKSWRCTMVWSAYLGLPFSLEGVGLILGLEKQKMMEGKDLIRYFCKPCKPTVSNGERTRNLPEHDLEKWDAFKVYNKRDVEAEQSIQERLAKFPVPDDIWDEYRLDQQINDRGVALDMVFVHQAIEADERSRSESMNKMYEITELQNPNSVTQMKQWLSDNGLETDSLDKKAVSEMIQTAPKPLDKVLALRQSLAKSSVKKFTAMENSVCSDGRARGMFFFYGANRTGRWSGRIIQLQNLPANKLVDLEQARNLVLSGNYEALEMLYENVPDTLSQLIRTAFIPKTGDRFIVADFSAIEARVISWFAGESWRNEVFSTHGKIYEASASQMFNVPLEEVTKGSPLRQKGKLAELGLGFGGSVGALKAMGALETGLTEEELKPLVDSWRAANPNIVRFWWDIDRAVKTAIKDKTRTKCRNIEFEYRSGMLFVQLPSGRRLAYVKPRIGENRFGGESVTYEGIGAARKWERIESYGPKFVENIVQATARDILAEAMLRISKSGYEIVMHCHDEAVLEVPFGKSSVEEVCRIMTQTPPWAEGLVLRADGYECEFYKKD